MYSAYVERRTVAAVRIIAATKTRGADSVMCRVWLPDNRTLTLKARVKVIDHIMNVHCLIGYHHIIQYNLLHAIKRRKIKYEFIVNDYDYSDVSQLVIVFHFLVPILFRLFG